MMVKDTDQTECHLIVTFLREGVRGRDMVPGPSLTGGVRVDGKGDQAQRS